MLYRALKRVTKSYRKIFCKPTQTHEIRIQVGDSEILIAEQQCGRVFSPPHPAHVSIYDPKTEVTYEMDYDIFLEKISQ